MIWKWHGYALTPDELENDPAGHAVHAAAPVGRRRVKAAWAGASGTCSILNYNGIVIDGDERASRLRNRSSLQFCISGIDPLGCYVKTNFQTRWWLSQKWINAASKPCTLLALPCEDPQHYHLRVFPICVYIHAHKWLNCMKTSTPGDTEYKPAAHAAHTKDDVAPAAGAS